MKDSLCFGLMPEDLDFLGQLASAVDSQAVIEADLFGGPGLLFIIKLFLLHESVDCMISQAISIYWRQFVFRSAEDSRSKKGQGRME